MCWKGQQIVMGHILVQEWQICFTNRLIECSILPVEFSDHHVVFMSLGLEVL